MAMKLLLSAPCLVALLVASCTSDGPDPMTADATPSVASPSPPAKTSKKATRRELRDECGEGIDGNGLGDVEHYPPRPYFEAFNVWRTKTRTGRSGCLRIAAGQQEKGISEGEDDPTDYYRNGWLFLFGDYRHYPRGLGKREVPLPRPVRVVRFSGSGYDSLILLQSLKDCSTITYDVAAGTFKPGGFRSTVKCPTRS